MAILERALGYGMAAAAGRTGKRFEEDSLEAARINRTVFLDILRGGRESQFGKKHLFSEIKTAEEYKNAVPLSSYADYKNYIEKIAAGEKNVLTADPVEYFGLSSGTTGKQKMIPVTARSRKVVNSHMMLLTQSVINREIPGTRRGGRGLMLMNAVTAGATAGGIPTGAATSGGMSSMKSIIPYLWTSPPEITQLADQQTAGYLHLLFALGEPKLMYINSPFPSAILQLFRLLEAEWPRLVIDLAGGRIGRHIGLEPEIRTALEERLRPNPARARQVSVEMEKGAEGVACRLWPGLLYICCVAGGSLSIYTEKLRRYIGGLPLYSAVYGATEAMIGISLQTGNTLYAVTPRTAYHEFIPLEEAERPQPRALDLDQLTPGRSYEVVVTNLAGLYRYRLGDIIKVVGYHNGCPLIEFQCRKGQLLNLSGEKTQESAARHALARAAGHWCSELVDYTTTTDLDSSPGRYVFYIEVEEPDRLPHIPALQADLDLFLGESNPRYLAAREAGRIGRVSVRIVKPGTFQRLQREMISRGASPNQVKIPRALQDDRMTAILQQNILVN